MIFQALGSNYKFLYAIRHLFTSGSAKDIEQLKNSLEDIFGGQAFLYGKGRHALAAAVSLLPSDCAVAINGITCSVVPEAIKAANRRINYLDIELTDGNFSAKELKKQLKADPTIKALVIQNTYGNMQDIKQIEKVAKDHQLYLIEDLAHSIGLEYADGRNAGTVGDLVMLSFGRDKIIDAVNGGALIVRNPKLLKSVQSPNISPKKLSQLRDRIYPILMAVICRLYRFSAGKVLLFLAYKLRLATRSADGGIDVNQKLPAWQAKLIFKQLKNIQSRLKHRQKIMKTYHKHLGKRLLTPSGTIRGAVLVNNRERLLKKLEIDNFMLADTWYDRPIGPVRKYDTFNYPETTNKQSIFFTSQVINLPTHQFVNRSTAKRLAELIIKEEDA